MSRSHIGMFVYDAHLVCAKKTVRPCDTSWSRIETVNACQGGIMHQPIAHRPIFAAVGALLSSFLLPHVLLEL